MTFFRLSKAQRVALPLCLVFVAGLAGAQAGKESEAKEFLWGIVDQMNSGELSHQETFKKLHILLEEPLYSKFLGPHVAMMSLSDTYFPDQSEKVFRRAISSLEGKDLVVFLMRYFDRAMEIDRVYLYDEDRVQKDDRYRQFWEDRQFYEFTVDELDVLSGCHDIFAEKDEWRASELRDRLNEKPCSDLKMLGKNL